MKLINLLSKIALLAILLVLATNSLAFDPVKANATLDTLTVSAATNNILPKELEGLQKELIEQKKLADQCIDEKTKELFEITNQLTEATEGEDDSGFSTDQSFLLKRKGEINSILGSCKVYSFRANELLANLSSQAKEVRKSYYFTRSDPLWKYFPMLHKTLKNWVDTLQKEKLHITFEIKSYTYVDLCFVTLLLILSFIFSSFLKQGIKFISAHLPEKNSYEKHLVSFLNNVKRKTTVIISLSILLIYEHIHDQVIEADLLFDNLILPILFFYLAQVFFGYITTPPFSHEHFNGKKKSEIKSLKIALNIILSIILIKYFIHELFPLMPEDKLLWKLGPALFYTAITIAFFKVINTYLRLNTYFNTHLISKTFFYTLNYFFLMFVIASMWNGYFELSTYIMKGVIYTVSSIIIAITLYIISTSTLENLTAQKYAWQRRAFKFLQSNHYNLMLELITLKLTLFLIIWGCFFVYLNDIWSISDLWPLQLREYIFSGVVVVETQIQPIRIIFALLLFSIITFTVKIIKYYLNPKETSANKAAQEAYIIIFGYIGMSLAIILALLTAGVDLRGLAIVAGALSFGIGFGLQNIVNNFISGLILLIERPIKKGDRIYVGDKEGFVTQVGVRSTHIQTLELSHIIVPNSDLVTKEVKNYMLNNKRFRVQLNIAVQHDACPSLVKELLLATAFSHDDVIKEGADEPTVFYLGYYESGLNFSLWCSIDNVNNKFLVRSDLFFKMDAIFRENGIQYAFAQSDIHIKHDESSSVALLPRNET